MLILSIIYKTCLVSCQQFRPNIFFLQAGAGEEAGEGGDGGADDDTPAGEMETDQIIYWIIIHAYLIQQ